MLICAIDTSGRNGSLALAEADANSFAILHSATIAGGTYSAELIPALSGALTQCRKQKTDIGLFAVASGPGSFTGLRVGLSTVKALAEVLHLPVVAMSVLEAVAFATGKHGPLLSALDAQRKEVFVGEFEIGPRSVKTVQEVLVSASDFVRFLSGKGIVYTPDPAVEVFARESGSAVELVTRPDADVYARLGFQKYLAGETSSIDELDANYIRRSDAEIFSAPKLGIKTS
jgi:tRNA threonylcarbamoyladenosine biosynthesis protein TsaB